MANTVGNVLSGAPLAAGGLYRAPKGTALPTTATAALDAAFKPLGYIGDGGLTETPSRSTDKKKAWGGDIVKVVQTDFSVTYEFTLLETLLTEAQKTAFGDANVTETLSTVAADTWVVKLNGDTLEHYVYVAEIKDGNARKRIVVPDGQVTETGQITYSESDVTGFQCTLEGFKDFGLNANAIHYLTDGTIDTP